MSALDALGSTLSDFGESRVPNLLTDACESRLTIHIRCNNLRNMDFIGRSDPFALLYLDNTGSAPRMTPAALPIPNAHTQNRAVTPAASTAGPVVRPVLRATSHTGRDPAWRRIGVTEVVSNTLNPHFATSFEIPYFFERAQRLAVDVFDRDTADPHPENSLEKHDYLGSAEVPLPSVVRAPGQKVTLELHIPRRPNARCGTVTLTVEELSEYKERITYEATLHHLNRLSTGFPVLTVLRSTVSSGAGQHEKDSWITVFRGRLVPHPPGTNSSPSVSRSELIVPGFSHNYERFARCDDSMLLKFEVSYENRYGHHRVVASGMSSLAEADANDGVIRLSNSKQRCLPFGHKDTFLRLNNRTMTKDVTFLDYIIGGCEISLVIAIDFTASNGDPEQIGTLHFLDPMKPNEYEMAIRSVGDILGAYDTDQLFPTFGFGAKLPPHFDVPCHKFSLNSDPEGYLNGIDDVLNAYRHALHNVCLSGPTVLSEIVRAAADHTQAELEKSEQAYTILLVVTDGVVNDLSETLIEIARGSSLPLSIVIIGVGGIDFADINLLLQGSADLERDIVQFVRFRQFVDAPEVLRSCVLEQIPTQFLQYMSRRNIQPMPVPMD